MVPKGRTIDKDLIATIANNFGDVVLFVVNKDKVSTFKKNIRISFGILFL